MRYKGLLKLGKDSYMVSFSFLEKLNLTQKEAILLQQIDYNNKTSAFLDIPKTILAEITRMSRGHLYRALKKLRNLGLIIESELGICTSDSYKELKKQDEIQTFKKKNKKIAKNVAFEMDKKRAQNSIKDSINAIDSIKDSIKTDSINTTESSKKDSINSQNSQTFFMTKESQNVTKVSHFETDSIHYKQENNISLSLQDKENIYFSPLKKDENKSLILRGKIKDLLDKLNSTIASNDCYMPNDSYLFQKIDSMIKEQEKVKLDENTLSKLEKLGIKESYLAFTKQLRYTGLFLNAKAKQSFIDETKRLISTNKITQALKISKEEKKLWITTNSDYIGRRLLAQTWKQIIEILEAEISQNTESKKPNNSEEIIASMLEKHGEKIQEFINFRAKKGRNFNAAALNALYATLGIAFERGKDIEAMINQSIHRDYNWVFPLTHRIKKRKKFA